MSRLGVEVVLGGVFYVYELDMWRGREVAKGGGV